MWGLCQHHHTDLFLGRPYAFCRVMSLELACEMTQVSPVSPGSFLGLSPWSASSALTTVTCHLQRPRALVAVVWSPSTGLSESLGALVFQGPRVAWPTHDFPQSKWLYRPRTVTLTLHFYFVWRAFWEPEGLPASSHFW